jgi:hypothetical protein
MLMKKDLKKNLQNIKNFPEQHQQENSNQDLQTIQKKPQNFIQ